jgi:hypothetical protein
VRGSRGRHSQEGQADDASLTKKERSVLEARRGRCAYRRRWRCHVQGLLLALTCCWLQFLPRSFQFCGCTLAGPNPIIPPCWIFPSFTCASRMSGTAGDLRYRSKYLAHSEYVQSGHCVCNPATATASVKKCRLVSKPMLYLRTLSDIALARSLAVTWGAFLRCSLETERGSRTESGLREPLLHAVAVVRQGCVAASVGCGSHAPP